MSKMGERLLEEELLTAGISTIVDLDSEGARQLALGIKKAFMAHEIAAAEFVEPFCEELLKDPREAIKRIREVYNRALDSAYGKDRAFAEAIAGGPCEDIPWAVYNAVGMIYPHLKREDKDFALGQILSILDGRNYAEVNGMRGYGHTPGIREPLLLSDICIARHLYWPGLNESDSEGRRLAIPHKNFDSFREEFIDSNGLFNPGKVNSDFLVAYYLLRRDYGRFGDEYVRIANPAFLERVMKGIVALRFGLFGDETEESIRKADKRLREVLIESQHEKIDAIREARDWVDKNKFK